MIFGINFGKAEEEFSGNQHNVNNAALLDQFLTLRQFYYMYKRQENFLLKPIFLLLEIFTKFSLFQIKKILLSTERRVLF